MKKHQRWKADQLAQPYTIVKKFIGGRWHQAAEIKCGSCGGTETRTTKISQAPEYATSDFLKAGWTIGKIIKCPSCSKVRRSKKILPAPTLLLPIEQPTIAISLTEQVTEQVPAKITDQVEVDMRQPVDIIAEKSTEQAPSAPTTQVTESIQHVLMKPLENVHPCVVDLMGMEFIPDSGIALRNAVFALQAELDKYNQETLVPLDFAVFDSKLMFKMRV